MAASLKNDEFPLHPIPQTEYWGENYVVAFHDPVNGIGSMLSMGRWVFMNKLWRNMSYLALPNDRVYLSRNMGLSTDPKVPDSGVFKLEVLEPGRKLRYTFEGPMEERTMTELNTIGLQVGRTVPVRFELTFESDNPMWDQHEELGENDSHWDDRANYNSPDGHIEQNGTVTGKIHLPNNESYNITAVATRDHSRGKRDLTPYKQHLWTNGMFPSGRSFNLFTLKAHGFDGIAAGRGCLIVDGKLHDANVHADSGCWLNQPGDLFKPTWLTLDSPTLGKVEIRATKIINSVPLLLMYPGADHYWSVASQSQTRTLTWVNEQKVVWNWDGEEGHGHLERGNSRFSPNDPDWQANFR